MPNPVGNMVIKVDLDGSGFNKGVTGLNRQMRMVSKELSANLSKFSRYDNSLEKSKVKVDGLTKRQRVQKEVVKELRQNYDRLSAETGENSAKTQAAAAKYNEAIAKLNLYDRELEEATKHMKSLQDHQKALNTSLGKLGNNFSKFGPQLKTMGDGMKSVGRSMGLYVTAPIVAGFGAAVKASIDYESAFAGVRKTVNGSEKDYKKLSDGIINMSKNLPVAATDIAEVGEMAGQLGIKKSNILDFSKTIIDLGESTNLTREQAATEFARFANIVDMPQKSFSRLGSSIVALGNNMATTESEIMSMSMRIAAQGKLVGMTESDITGLAATMSSLGIEAEAGGTAMTTVLKKIDKAVGAGGKELKAFADASGVSSAEFKKQWEKDPVKALDTFIGGLAKSKKEGANLSEMLADLGIKGIRESDTILRMANNHKLLGKAVKISGKGWKENKALSNEANQRYKTMASQLKILKNNVVAFGISLGDAIAPIVIKLAKGLTGVLKSMSNMSNGMKITIAVVGSLVAAIGPVVFIFGSFISVVGSAMTTLGPLLIGISKAGGLMAFLSSKVATAVRMFPALGTAISFAGGPLLWIVGGLTALGIGFTIAYKKSETFRNIVNKAVSGVMNTFKAAKIALQGFFQLFKGNGQDGVITLSKILPPNVVVGLTNFATTVKRVFFQVINTIKAFGLQIGQQLSTFWKKNGTEITQAVRNIGNVISTVFKFIWGNIIQPIMTLIWNLMKLLWPAIKALIVSVWNNIKGVIQGALNIILGTIKIFSSILTGNWKGAWNGLVQVLKGVVQLIWNLVQLWFVGKIVKVAKLGMSLLKGVFTKGWKFIHTFIATTAYAIWNSVKQKFSGLNKSIKAIVTSIKKWLSNTWSAIKKSVVNQAQSLWSGVKSKFSSLWKSTKSIFTNVKNFLLRTWNYIKNMITNKVHQLWYNVRRKFKELQIGIYEIIFKLRKFLIDKWTDIKGRVVGIVTTLKSNVVNGFKAMYDKGKSWLNKLKNFIGDSKEAFKKKAASLGKAAANGAISGLNKMIGGINKISKAITDKNLIKKIPKLSTGTSGAIKSPTAAIVNDKGPGNGSGPKGHQELIVRRDGSLHAPIGRNVLVGLGKGDSVINGRHTQQLVRTGVIPQFHGGKNSEKEKDNILSQAKDKAGKFGADVLDTAHSAVDKSKKTVKAGVSAAKKGASYLGDKIGDVWDYVKNPKKLIDKMLGSINFGGSKANATMRMAGGAFKKLKKSLVGKVKSWFEEAEGGDGDAAWLFKHDIWQKFGAYTGGLGFNGGKHYGMDFGMTPGTPVYAVKGGIAKALSDYGGGKMVQVKTGANEWNWYAHLSKQLVKAGQRVQAGDKIALSGNTGAFTRGSGHLHFQLMRGSHPGNDTAIDPHKWLKNLQGAGGGSKAASKWRGDIIRAGKAMSVKLSSGDIQDIISLIHTESGGRPGVTQSGYTDVNTGGNEARGLLQYTPGTWNAYKAKGAGNILNGYHQLKTFFNNSNWRRDLSAWKARIARGQTGWGPTGSRRFATGGKVWDGLYHLGEEGYPEWIIPSDPSRSNDAWKLLALAANDLEKSSPKSKRPNNLPNPSNSSSGGNSSLEQKFDALIGLVSKLVSTNEEIANKDYEPVIDKYSLENEVFKLIEKYERTKSRKNRYNVAT
ncbi:phage tail tape measure protein [Mammaliicoccus sciuri]|uniref:phage tail tape measure protein n=1 Tax=Mammaliicoccus sciuri TaxID=1296 RepID=UPI0023423CCF|nr:phage tail tape measure protein [Mammaliicoccus sciuri]MDC5694281.1 phage tail tape measure protein [Mammaliicoccus sciuri]